MDARLQDALLLSRVWFLAGREHAALGLRLIQQLSPTFDSFVTGRTARGFLMSMLFSFSHAILIYLAGETGASI